MPRNLANTRRWIRTTFWDDTINNWRIVHTMTRGHTTRALQLANKRAMKNWPDCVYFESTWGGYVL